MTESHDDSLIDFLEQITPFRFLSLDEKRALIPHLQRVEFAPGHTIIQQGETGDRAVYLISQGEVEVLDRTRIPRPRLQVIEAGHYVGEWEPLFEEPLFDRSCTVSANWCFSSTSCNANDSQMQLLHRFQTRLTVKSSRNSTTPTFNAV